MEYEIRYYFSEAMKEANKVAFTEHSNESRDKVIVLANHRVIHSQFGFTCYEIIDIN